MTSRKVLVTGATGQQGGGVAKNLLAADHKVKALVRDLNAPKALALQAMGAELAEGNFDDSDSLKRAMDGVESVFGVGTPMAGLDAEIAQGNALVDAAAGAGVNHFVFSSVAGAASNSGIGHFDSKYVIEERLKSTGMNWSILAPVFFMDNVLFPWNTADMARGVFRQAMTPDTRLQLISAADIGKFYAAVIEGGEPFYGKRIEIAGDELTGPEMAAVLGASIGSEVVYEEQPREELDAWGPDTIKMYDWFVSDGFSVDIANLKATYPEIGWATFSKFSSGIDWKSALAA